MGWADKLLELLYREIVCDCVDKSPLLATPYGEMIFWVDDEGLLASPIAHNDRAIALARAVGWNTPDLAGVVVITGGYTEEGETLGVPSQLLSVIAQGIAEATANEDDVE